MVHILATKLLDYIEINLNFIRFDYSQLGSPPLSVCLSLCHIAAQRKTQRLTGTVFIQRHPSLHLMHMYERTCLSTSDRRGFTVALLTSNEILTNLLTYSLRLCLCTCGAACSHLTCGNCSAKLTTTSETSWKHTCSASGIWLCCSHYTDNPSLLSCVVR